MRRFVNKLNVGMTADMRAAVEAEADARELPAAEIVRLAVARGLPLISASRQRDGK